MGKTWCVEMGWIPTKKYIFALYEEYIGETVPLINHEGLMGTLDKVHWGIPYKKELNIWEKATILYKEIVENHYFADGNKRIGILITYIFLNKNGYNLQPPKGEIYSTTMKIAQKELAFDEIQNWLQKNTRKIK